VSNKKKLTVSSCLLDECAFHKVKRFKCKGTSLRVMEYAHRFLTSKEVSENDIMVSYFPIWNVISLALSDLEDPRAIAHCMTIHIFSKHDEKLGSQPVSLKSDCWRPVSLSSFIKTGDSFYVYPAIFHLACNINGAVRTKSVLKKYLSNLESKGVRPGARVASQLFNQVLIESLLTKITRDTNISLP
jgi:hypothetical protein